MEPTMNKQYLGIITALSHVFMTDHQHQFMYQWLLAYIANDLIWYTMQLLKKLESYELTRLQNFSMWPRHFQANLFQKGKHLPLFPMLVDQQ